MAKIKSCPFCGRMPDGPRRLSDISTYKQVGRTLELTDCHEVWIMTCEMHATIYGRSAENTIKNWNTRVNDGNEI